MQSKCHLAWLVLSLLVITAETAYCFLHPIAYFDTFAYASMQHSMAGANSFAAAGQSCQSALPGAYNGCAAVTSSEMFGQTGGLSPSEYTAFLRFYTVKPLYNALVQAVSFTFRVDVWQALRLVSAGSFLLTGMLCVLWLRRLTRPAIATLGTICLMSLPGTLGLGRALLPDALLTMVLLLGAFFLTVLRQWKIGGVILMLATLVRPDALLFTASLGGLLMWQMSTGQRRWKYLVTLALVAGGWALILARATGALPWRVLFIHSFVAWTPPAEYFSLRVGVSDYLRVIASNGVRTALFCLPLPGLLALIAWSGRRCCAPVQQVVLAGLIAITLRVLLFPGVEDRYYAWFTLLAGIAAVSTATTIPAASLGPTSPHRRRSASRAELPRVFPG